MNLHIVVLAAGEGTRMASRIPKVLHPLAGEPVIYYVLRAALALKPQKITVIVGQEEERIKAKVLEEFSKVKGLEFVRQTKALGTAYAVACARKSLAQSLTVLVLCGDVPLVSKDTLEDLLSFHHREHNQATVLTAKLANPAGYGRVLRGPTNVLLKIVEEKDASLRDLQAHEINSGIYVFEREALLIALALVKPNNVMDHQ